LWVSGRGGLLLCRLMLFERKHSVGARDSQN
jgi:hypothetical protein